MTGPSPTSRLGEALGSYRIVGAIGAGGMGEVYLAEHTLIGRKAAIKVLRPAFTHDPRVVERFFNEARASALIKHPGIIDVLDFGHDAGGDAYIVMEFLEGESLAQRLQRVDRLEPAEMIHIVKQVASAVGAAHQAGIVHRDLKPDNFFLVADPHAPGGERVKVLDFGIAKLSADLGGTVTKTRTGSILGSPLYMSPEQCKDARLVDHRSDVYSLGCAAYEMVCGRAPFVAELAGEVAAMHIFQPPPPPRRFRRELSPALEAVLLRALEKDVDRRYGSMAELAAALEATEAAPAIAARADRRAWIAGTVVAVVGIGVVGLVALRSSGPDAGVSAAGAGPPDAAPAARAESVAAAGATRVETAPDAGAPAAARRVTIHIRSTPPGASVLDEAGARLGATPFAVTLDAAEVDLHYLVRLAGYQDRRLTLSGARDGAEDVALTRSRRPPPREPGDPVDPYGDPHAPPPAPSGDSPRHPRRGRRRRGAVRR